jgi:hypothetical protein
MICKGCKSPRILQVSAKCADCFTVAVGGHEHDGYVPGDLGIGDGDYVEFDMCMNCGRVQGSFPLAEAELERGESED